MANENFCYICLVAIVAVVVIAGVTAASAGITGFAVKESKGACGLFEERCSTIIVPCYERPCPLPTVTKQCCALAFACQMDMCHGPEEGQLARCPEPVELQECMARAVPSGSGSGGQTSCETYGGVCQDPRDVCFGIPSGCGLDQQCGCTAGQVCCMTR